MSGAFADGFAAMERYLTSFPERARTSASLAINQTAQRKGMQAIREDMRGKIAFPPGYLEDRTRLGVTQFAKPDNLEAVITGRDRPTSLARFASRGGGRTNPTVRVGANRSRLMSGTFLIPLLAGRGADATLSNVGLAIRLRPGERVRNKRVMVPFGAGLYLLYGPSVGQVFRTVSQEVAPRVADLLVDEFLRQFARKGDA